MMKELVAYEYLSSDVYTFREPIHSCSKHSSLGMEMVESSALFLHLSLSDSELDSGDSDLDWIPRTFLYFLLKSSIGDPRLILIKGGSFYKEDF